MCENYFSKTIREGKGIASKEPPRVVGHVCCCGVPMVQFKISPWWLKLKLAIDVVLE